MGEGKENGGKDSKSFSKDLGGVEVFWVEEFQTEESMWEVRARESCSVWRTRWFFLE